MKSPDRKFTDEEALAYLYKKCMAVIRSMPTSLEDFMSAPHVYKCNEDDIAPIWQVVAQANRQAEKVLYEGFGDGKEVSAYELDEWVDEQEDDFPFDDWVYDEDDDEEMWC